MFYGSIVQEKFLETSFTIADLKYMYVILVRETSK